MYILRVDNRDLIEERKRERERMRRVQLMVEVLTIGLKMLLDIPKTIIIMVVITCMVTTGIEYRIWNMNNMNRDVKEIYRNGIYRIMIFEWVCFVYPLIPYILKAEYIRTKFVSMCSTLIVLYTVMYILYTAQITGNIDMARNLQNILVSTCLISIIVFGMLGMYTHRQEESTERRNTNMMYIALMFLFMQIALLTVLQKQHDISASVFMAMMVYRLTELMTRMSVQRARRRNIALSTAIAMTVDKVITSTVGVYMKNNSDSVVCVPVLITLYCMVVIYDNVLEYMRYNKMIGNRTEAQNKEEKSATACKTVLKVVVVLLVTTVCSGYMNEIYDSVAQAIKYIVDIDVYKEGVQDNNDMIVYTA